MFEWKPYWHRGKGKTIPYKKNRDATHAIVLDVIDCPLGVLLGICLLIPKVLGAVSINTGSIRAHKSEKKIELRSNNLPKAEPLSVHVVYELEDNPWPVCVPPILTIL